MDSLQNLINQALSGGITNDANDISSDIFNTNNKRGEMDFPLIIKRPSSDGGEENSFEETLRRQQSRSGIGRYVPSIKKEHMLEPPILQRMSFPYVIKKTKFLPALLKRIYQLVSFLKHFILWQLFMLRSTYHFKNLILTRLSCTNNISLGHFLSF